MEYVWYQLIKNTAVTGKTIDDVPPYIDREMVLALLAKDGLDGYGNPLKEDSND